MRNRTAVEWFLYDLKEFAAQTRKLGRRSSYLALTDDQRENLVETQQELITELERIQKLCQPSSLPRINKELEDEKGWGTKQSNLFYIGAYVEGKPP